MSQRTSNGAYVDAMLKAYRRTLEKTLEQARSMEQVVADPTVRILADTPDKAVVWGFALRLHDQVAEVLRRNLEDASADPTRVGPPTTRWLGNSPSTLYDGTAGAARAASSPAPACPYRWHVQRHRQHRLLTAVIVIGRGRIRRRRGRWRRRRERQLLRRAAGADPCQRVSYLRCLTNDDPTDAPAAADPAAPEDPATAPPWRPPTA